MDKKLHSILSVWDFDRLTIGEFIEQLKKDYPMDAVIDIEVFSDFDGSTQTQINILVDRN